MPAMETATDAVPHPFFLEAPSGRLYAVHHRPTDRAQWRGHVLCVPPFNEEMNRCRSMITLQALALARIGFGTLVVDLHGTGDSAGHYRDARWNIWLEDLRTAYDWLHHQPGGCAGLLGIRLGAILGAQLHAQLATNALALMLWQPVVDGKIHMNQFMRLRIAAQMDRPHLPKETTASMRASLASGNTLEVSGYEVHPELVQSIDASRMTEHAPAAGSEILWLEHAGADTPEVPAASQKAAAEWSAASCLVALQTYSGPQFWQVHERVVTPSIIEQTTAWFGARTLRGRS